jgi:ornithine lipid ester-linked acyl 2-hydroxylase
MDAPSSAPQQHFGTAGTAPLSRPGAVTRLFMAAVAWAERLNLRYARLGNPPVYDKAVFPWVHKLEAGWPLVRAEAMRSGRAT